MSTSVKLHKNSPFKWGKKRKVMDFRHNAFQVLVDACTLIQLCIKKVECIFFFISTDLDNKHIHGSAS